jgi:dihydrofolate reductase
VGKLVVSEFVSLDGMTQDPGGAEQTAHGGWTFQFDRGDEGNAFKVDELMAADAHLLGRVTYDGFAAAWPGMTGMGPYGEKMNSMPKYVVSKTLSNPTWNNTTVLNGDLKTDVDELKNRYAGDILVAGSASLVQSLLALDLVDELRLMVFPIVLGSGKPLFAEGPDTTRFHLADVKKFGDVAVLTLTSKA